MQRTRYRLPIRPNAYTWRIVARIGAPNVPHTLVASRLRWTFDQHRMRLMQMERGAIQTVPGGTGDSYIAALVEYDARARSKGDAGVALVCDVSRSLEMRHNIARKVKGVQFCQVKNLQEDEWKFPMRVVGRQLALSRLQSWMTDRKIGTSLPTDSDDDNFWSRKRFERALAAMQSRPPKFDGDEIIHEPTVDDEVILSVALATWWGEAGRPSIHEPTPNIADAAGIASAEQAAILANLERERMRGNEEPFHEENYDFG